MANDLRVQAELIVALTDLKVVRGIRNAVRVNLLKQGGREGPLGNIENPKPPPSLPNFGEQRTSGVPLDPPRSLDRPITGISVRPVDRPGRIDGGSLACRCPTAANAPALDAPQTIVPTGDAERAAGFPDYRRTPLVPPWEMPTPVVATPPPSVVKYEVQPPDLVTKGLLIDFFM